MDKTALREFLQKKYESPEAFLENVIYPVFGEDKYDTAGNLNWLRRHPEDQTAANNAGIVQILLLGSIYVEGSELNVFDITVASKRHLANNRVGIQALIRRIISTYSGAFMIFHYQTSDRWDWRFSFCHKGASQLDSSDAKRYTFLLGPGQSCRTAADNFCKLSEKIAGGEFEMADIVKAFDVEALSKEFFDKYKAQYAKFVSYMADEANGMRAAFIDTGFDTEGLSDEQIRSREEKPLRDYVKKLLGRIVFLHFIQKKGWLGVEPGKQWCEGDMDFMMNLYDKATADQQANFLDEVLEPLFENGLNTNRSADGDLFDTGVKALPNGGVVKIPYLNGGLFERESTDEPDTVFPAEYFKSLLTFFSQYNFTIDENDPNDAQVGIDPEMLGRIFENLLEDNKDKGAYYTPKEIVQYMCRESLIAYLQTDKPEDEKQAIRDFVTTYDTAPLSEALKAEIDSKLKAVKICDPAIGSGAFPMGLLRELFLCRGALENFDDAAEIKRHIIQQNIYGVDIEKGAVDIARLRFWLCLIVDEETPNALPNLDFKVMQGNSLLESYKGIDLSGIVGETGKNKKIGDGQLSLMFDERDVLVNLQNLIDTYYNLPDHQAKNDARKEINELVRTYVKKYAMDDPTISAEIDALPIPNDQFFLWHTYFNEVFREGGFDIVIGNPPYIKEYTNKSAFDGFRETSPYYMGKMDLWYGFACNGIDLLKENGILSFIAQNNWTTSTGAKLMRQKVIRDTVILQLLDFNDYMVFGGSASIQTMVMIFQKNNTVDNYPVDLRKIISSASKNDALDMLKGLNTAFVKSTSHRIIRKLYENRFITFSNQDSLLDKIAFGKSSFMEDELAQGIVFPQDFLNKKGALKLGHHKVGDGIFGLSNDEYENLVIPQNERNLIKPYYTSDQIHRYYTDPNNQLWMIYTDSSFNNIHSLDKYPVIKHHLDQFQSVITSSNKPYGLHRARNEKFFKGAKILSLRKCVGHPCFSYSDFDCYVTQTYYSIKTERWSLLYLTGLLNSKLIEFWLHNRGKMQGNNFQIDKEPLLDIPIASSSMIENEIAKLVEQILHIKSHDSMADISDIETSIDKLVYSLYDLSPEEIAIVESE